MRFSFVVSAGLGYHIQDLFETRPSFTEFQRALKLLREQGFSGVEINVGVTKPNTLSKILESIRREGLPLAAIGTGMLYLKRGYSFTARNPTKRRRAIAAVKDLIQFASKEHAVLILGLIRGGISVVETTRPLCQALVECDGVASEYGVQLALEAINRYETSQLNTATDVAQVIHDEELRSTGLLLDTFHMNIEEASIEETIRNHHEMIVHFHIADSNRWPPGRGHLHVEGILRSLDELGYRGWVSAEVLPNPDNASAVIETATFLRDNNFLLR
jgi:sugar phosphate isomerase/epimerase